VYGDDDGFGALGRRLRELRGGRTQPGLAHRLGVSVSTVCRAEKGELSADTANAYDRHFAAAGVTAPGQVTAMWEAADRAAGGGCDHSELAELARAGGGLLVVVPAGSGGHAGPAGRNLALPCGPYSTVSCMCDQEMTTMPVNRRCFTAGMGLGLVSFGDETLRQDTLRSLVGDGWNGAEEWQHVARGYFEHAVYYRTPPARVIGRLDGDLRALAGAAGRERDETQRAGLLQAGALLAHRMSEVNADLGDLPGCARWARAALKMADLSGDTHTRLWVRGREVVLGLYKRRPVDELLDLAAETTAIGDALGWPRTSARAVAAAGVAQASAVAGRRADAWAALGECRDALDAIDGPRDPSRLGFSDHNLLFAEAYVGTHAGDAGGAGDAYDAAAGVYPRTEQVEVMRALHMTLSGDAAAGVAHARDAIAGLTPAMRVHTVTNLGRQVVEATPAGMRTADDVVELRELVGV
jgi:DNA-binding XRE family transcriptional regulator